MNLTKLFETQKVLRDRIGYEGEDRFEKLILALLVEIGECANEWRGFKFWSKDQEPRTEENITCESCNGTGDLNFEYVQEEAEGRGGHEYFDCPDCDCSGYSGTKNPLLEEYVDGLHFVLELGLEVEFDINITFGHYIGPDVTTQFNNVYQDIVELNTKVREESGNENIIVAYNELVCGFIGLGEMIGFTWEQIEQAYYAKNQINHERQDTGY